MASKQKRKEFSRKMINCWRWQWQKQRQQRKIHGNMKLETFSHNKNIYLFVEKENIRETQR